MLWQHENVHIGTSPIVCMCHVLTVCVVELVYELLDLDAISNNPEVVQVGRLFWLSTRTYKQSQ